MQGNPLLSFATGILQSRSATPNGHDLLSLNKLMREAKSMPGSLLVDCVSTVIICLAHGRGRCMGEPPRWIIHEWSCDHDGASEHPAR